MTEKMRIAAARRTPYVKRRGVELKIVDLAQGHLFWVDPDGGGTLQIPRATWQRLGWQPGDRVYLQIHQHGDGDDAPVALIAETR